MSEPWPPAFMRSAPPIEPGTPTAHSNPVRPAATVRRASTGSGTAEPAVTDARAVDGDVAAQLGERDDDAVEAGVGHEHVATRGR